VVRKEEESAEECEDDPSPPSDFRDSAERSDGIEDESDITLAASGRPAIQPDLFRMHLLYFVICGDSSWRVFMPAQLSLVPAMSVSLEAISTSRMSQTSFMRKPAPLLLCRART
jgi:hypothetical protein